MCKAFLIGEFEKGTREVFRNEQLIECKTGLEASHLIKGFRPDLLVIKDELSDGIATKFVRAWQSERKLNREITKVVILGTDIEESPEINALALSDESERVEMLEKILEEIKRPPTDSGIMYFINKLDAVKVHLQRTNEELQKGLES